MGGKLRAAVMEHLEAVLARARVHLPRAESEPRVKGRTVVLDTVQAPTPVVAEGQHRQGMAGAQLLHRHTLVLVAPDTRGLMA